MMRRFNANTIIHRDYKKDLKVVLEKLRSKQAVMVVLLVLIAVAGYLNMSMGDSIPPIDESLTTMVDLNKDEDLGQAKLVNAEAAKGTKATVEKSTVYFASAKIERETSRSKAIELLKGVIDNANTDADTRAKAQKSMMGIADYIDMEANVENLIRAKGFADAVAYINEKGAIISVKTAQSLVPSDVAKIQEIVTEQTKLEVSKIKIVEIK